MHDNNDLKLCHICALQGSFSCRYETAWPLQVLAVAPGWQLWWGRTAGALLPAL